MTQEIFPPGQDIPPQAPNSPPGTGIVHAVYALFAIGIFLHGIPMLFGIPPFAILVYVLGAIIVYANRSSAQGTWLASHYEVLSKLFWVTVFISLFVTLGFWGGVIGGLGGLFTGSAGTFISMGMLTVFAMVIGVFYVIWFVIVCAINWIKLLNNRPAA